MEKQRDLGIVKRAQPMKKLLVVFLLSLVIVGFTVMGFVYGGYYYRDDPARNGAVGIVDLQAVANSMGWTEDMRRNSKQAQDRCQAEVDAYLKPLRDAYDHKLHDLAIGAKCTDEQIKKAPDAAALEKLGLTKPQIEELSGAMTALAKESNVAGARMNQVIQSQQQAVALACSRAAEPAVRRVATANHRGVILSAGGNLFYTEPAADLTDKIIDDLQHSTQTRLTFPEPPHLDLHPTTPATTQPR